MPIKGLEERIRLPRIGKFKLGVKKLHADGSPAGVESTPWFVVPDDLQRVVGAKPTEVRVRFPSTDPRLLFPHDLNRWGAGGLLTLRCDGAVCHDIPREGAERWTECQWRDRMKPCPCGATAEGRLSFLVLDDQGHAYGPYQVTIRGFQRVADVVGFLSFYIGLLGPRFIFTPFLLRRVPSQMAYQDKDGRRRTRTAHPIQIVCDGTLELPAGLPPGLEPRALPAAVAETAPDADETDDEPIDVTGATDLDGPIDYNAKDAFNIGAHDTSVAPAGLAQTAERWPRKPEVAGSTPAPSSTTHDGAEWTPERVATIAKQIGIGWQTFQQYLRVRFGLDFDALSAAQLATLGAELTAADAHGEVGRAKWKVAVFGALKEAATSRR